MKYYQEITLIADDEISPYFLWTKVYTQVHLAIVEAKNKHGLTGLGVSFPNYRYEKNPQNNKMISHLGNKLRIFAEHENELLMLNLTHYLARLSDYVHLKSIQNTPNSHNWAVFKRHNPNQSKNLIARRMAKKQNLNFESAFDKLTQDNYEPKKSDYPFIQLKSETTGQNFCLYIIKQDISTSELDNYSNEFNAYGLGMIVPDF